MVADNRELKVRKFTCSILNIRPHIQRSLVAQRFLEFRQFLVIQGFVVIEECVEIVNVPGSPLSSMLVTGATTDDREPE